MTRTLVVALVTLGDPGRLTGGYLYHRRMAALAPAQGARLEFVSFPERAFPLAALDGPRVLARVQQTGADALVLDSIAAAFLGPVLALRSPAVPLIGMLHQPPGGIDAGPPRSTVQAALDRLAYRRARLLMLASEALVDDLASAGVPRARLRVVPPGRDVATVTGPPPGDLRRGRRAALLCVGNWVERKGIHSLLEAFARLPRDAATLHLAGDDRAEPRYAARLRARLSRPDLAGRVVVHGPLTVEQVAALYAAADAFVLPSLKEPYGTVYGEAMAFGLPVVGWRAGNLPYLAEHEREGLILPPGDLEGLTRALASLAEDEALRRRLGDAARRRALARPTWEESAALFFGTIREVIVAG
jgi:glycosyltransferase involved in cell wall biosynthesis